MSDRFPQICMNPPVPGLFVAASEAAYTRQPPSRVTFGELLGYEPSADASAGWQVLPGMTVTEVLESGAGCVEVVVVVDDGLGTSPATHASAAIAEPALVEITVQPSVDGSSDLPVDARTFEEGLELAVFRTRSGAPERVWHP